MEPSSFDREAVLAEMTEAWDAFTRRRAALTEADLTVATDLAGWTGKDHLMHVVCWGNAAYDMLDRMPRWRSFGIPADLYRSGDFDAINAMLRDRYADLPLARIDGYLEVMHARAIRVMESVTPTVATQRYGDVSPEGMPHLQEAPLLRFLLGTQSGHLLEHVSFIESLAGR